MRRSEAETPANTANEAARTHPQSDEELVKVDGPAPVAVKLLKNSHGLFFLDGDSVVVQTLQELFNVQRAVAVVIHYFEGSAKETNSHSLGLVLFYLLSAGSVNHIII